MPGRGLHRRPEVGFTAMTEVDPASSNTSASPRDAVDIVLAGHADLRAEDLLEFVLPGEKTLEAGAVDCGGDVPARNAASRCVPAVERSEALDVGRRGSGHPAADWFCCFARPLRSMAFGQVMGLLQPIEGLRDELALELPQDRL